MVNDVYKELIEAGNCYATFYSILPPNPQLTEASQLHFATHSKSHSGHVPFLRFWHKKAVKSRRKKVIF